MKTATTDTILNELIQETEVVKTSLCRKQQTSI
jgi:hypothetical protein